MYFGMVLLTKNSNPNLMAIILNLVENIQLNYQNTLL